MPRTTGFEVLRSLPADVHRLHVVFVTGFAQHALAAFEIDVIAYLLKPVQQEKLMHMAERILHLRRHTGTPGICYSDVITKAHLSCQT